jgi:tRNA(fMet)-specific endonuclease VapC
LKYLVDTDWIINYLKGDEETVNILEQLYDSGFAISVISFSEIYEGIFYYEGKNRSKLERDFKQFLEGVIVVDVDENIGKIFGELRAELRKEGNLIDNFDLLIASTAIQNNLELLSNNVKHFKRIKGLRLKCLSDF